MSAWPIGGTGTTDADAADPREMAGLAGDKLLREILPAIRGLETPSWGPLQAKLHAITTEAGGAASRLPDYRNMPLPLQSRAAAFDEDLRSSKATISALHREASALAHQLREEWATGARPKVEPEREGFARQEVASLIDGAGTETLGRLVDIVRGSSRARAAVVLGDYGDAILQRLLPSATERDRFKQGLTVASIDGAIAHGTLIEKQYAKAARDVAPKVVGWMATRVQPVLGRLRDAEALRP